MPAKTEFRLARPRKKAQISLTPLIDVVFILLVFFMLVSSFLDWRSIDLATPSLGTAAAPLTGSILIDVEGQGVRIAGEPATDAELVIRLPALLAGDPDRPVVVRPVNDVVMQRLVRVMDLAHAAGVKTVSVAPGRGQ